MVKTYEKINSDTIKVTDTEITTITRAEILGNISIIQNEIDRRLARMDKFQQMLIKLDS